MYGQTRDRIQVSFSPVGELILEYPDGTDEATGVYPSTIEKEQARSFAQTTTGQSMLMRVFSRSIYDERTRLLNQRAARALIAKTLDRLMKLKCTSTVSVLSLDMNDFRRWNNDPSFGHAVGDLVIEWFGEILRLRTRASDIVSRWSTGDEFVIVTTASEAPAARKSARGRDNQERGDILRNGDMVAGRILVAARDGIIPYRDTVLHQTTTIGVATALLMPGQMPENLFQTLYERADRALSTGKTNGERDQVHVAELLTF